MKVNISIQKAVATTRRGYASIAFFSILKLIITASLISGITACGVSLPVKNRYQLVEYGHVKHYSSPKPISILVTPTTAVDGYQTEQMLYVVKPFEINAFVHNSWAANPSSMIYPLIMQSLESSNYFYAVSSSPYTSSTDYRLDSELIALQQSFLQKPSQVDFVVKVALSKVKSNRIIASHIFNLKVDCPMENPYGGAIAANKASLEFTTNVVDMVIKAINQSGA